MTSTTMSEHAPEIEEYEQPTKKRVTALSGRRPFRDITNLHVAVVAIDGKKQPSQDLDTPVADSSVPRVLPQASPEEETIATVKTSESAGDDVALLDLTFETEDDEELLAREIYERLLQKNMNNTVTSDYFNLQPKLNIKMRSILVDWLVEVHYRFKLQTQTLFLAVNYIDRFLATTTIERDQLQLVGVAGLFIAGKVEEIDPIVLGDMIYISDDMFTGEQIMDMERTMLAALHFDLVAPTLESFVPYLTKTLEVESTVKHFSSYFSQQALLHLPLLTTYAPGMLAAGCLYLAYAAANSEQPPSDWVLEWEHVTKFSLPDLTRCLQDLCATLMVPSRNLEALERKFSSKRYSRVAQHPLEQLSSFCCL
ncbi:hypothetical protein Poli38472_001658 [Pythium oligandrum]|uniref:Cyclin N-terminal domain-containing protein n=1 Tax=Pythium oligandrum TaxID=41045 RepID=A0A8K1CT92_PYTOL|nr:hypothetical protein Poli38472_001658 [Pythium oligandrum]|eukprot:TMW69502.1 hypothetical protein Poli38472_001658 [Pythium oligandrum]